MRLYVCPLSITVREWVSEHDVQNEPDALFEEGVVLRLCLSASDKWP